MPETGARQHGFRAALILIFLFSLWLRPAISMLAIPAAGHDDGLFVQLARSLLDGNWLGAYDERSLIKGMAYPLFIALCHIAGLPVKLAEHMLYLGAGLWLALVAGRLLRSRAAALALFALIAFNPAPFLPDMARILREGFYGSLGLLIFAAAGEAYLRDMRAARPLAGRLLPLVLLGLALGAFWLTREEREWILPPLALVPAAWLGQRYRRYRKAVPAVSPGRRAIAAEAGAILIPVAILALAVASVDLLNWRSYGVFRDNDLRSGAFQQAFGALWRVQVADRAPYAVFPAEARRAAYAVSPAAAELKPYLDGPLGAAWQSGPCAMLRLCREIPAAWFVWALREAAARAGHHVSAAEADRYYARLAAEIDQACRSGSLDCLASPAGLAPPFRWRYLAALPADLALAYRLLVDFGGQHVGLPESQGAPADIAAFSRFTGDEAAPAAAGRRLEGWVFSSHGRPALALIAGQGAAEGELTLAAAADVLAALPDSDNAEAVRFAVEDRSPAGDGQLLIHRPDAADVLIPLAEARPGRVLNLTDLAVHLDHVDPAGAPPALPALRRAKLALLDTLREGFRALLPIAAPASLLLLALLLAADLRRERLDPALLLAAALLAAVGLRLLLFAYLYAGFSPVYELRYLAPLYPLLLAAIGIVGWAAMRRAIGLRRSPT
jgi:hypothetical protein